MLPFQAQADPIDSGERGGASSKHTHKTSSPSLSGLFHCFDHMDIYNIFPFSRTALCWAATTGKTSPSKHRNTSKPKLQGGGMNRGGRHPPPPPPPTPPAKAKPACSLSSERRKLCLGTSEWEAGNERRKSYLAGRSSAKRKKNTSKIARSLSVISGQLAGWPR